MELMNRRFDLFKQLLQKREFTISIVIIVIIIVVGLRNPSFLTMDNWKDILMYVSILSLISVGQMLTILSGGIDLSVGSIVAFAGMSVGIIMRNAPYIHPAVLILFGAMIGATCGLFNGLIVGKGKVPPLITTLATMSIFRGLVVVVSGSRWVVYGDITEGFRQIARGKTLGINNLIFAALIVGLVFYYFLNHTRKGREIYAFGDNQDAAKFAGIRAANINTLVYTISGLLAGFGGILWVSRVNTAQSSTATGFEMQTIAACVIGGVSIMGGIGSVLGVFLGALMFGIILNSLELIGLVDFWKLSVQGFIILLALIVDSVMSRRTEEKIRKEKRIFDEK